MPHLSLQSGPSLPLCSLPASTLSTEPPSRLHPQLAVCLGSHHCALWLSPDQSPINIHGREVLSLCPCAQLLSDVQLFVAPWTVARPVPPSMDFSAKNTGAGIHFLLQEIFPTQGSNPGILHYRLIVYQLSYQGSPRILERVDSLFSRGSSLPRNRTRSPALQADSLPAELPGRTQRQISYDITYM